MTIYDYSALSVLIVLMMWWAMPMFARLRSISAQRKSHRRNQSSAEPMGNSIGGAWINFVKVCGEKCRFIASN
jgi:hypothetical protein